MNWFEAAVRWYVALLACTWALSPLVRWLCRGLADRGASITRPIALLVAIYPAWLIASLGAINFGAWAVIATVVVCGVVGWALFIRGSGADRSWLRALTLAETASLALFSVYVWLRGYTPQILGTEKPMDVAFLASSTRTLTMPPPDPWFAGETINYYYLGYLQHGTIGRITGVPPEISFNLALATIFSMTAVAAFGVAWNVARPRLGAPLASVSGLLAAFSVAVAGNLYTPWRLLQDGRGTVDAWWWDSAVGIGWRSSRIVCDGPRSGNLCPFPSTETINEFPFFSVLLGDLHPHLMALPFTVVALALAWNLAQRAASNAHGGSHAWDARSAISGAVVGSLLALNTWDFPTYMVAALFGAVVGCRGSLAQARRPLFLLATTSIVAWLPFLARYDPPTMPAFSSAPFASLPVVSSLTTAVAVHLGERTSAAEYLTIFGVPYAAGVAYVLVARIGRARQGAPFPTRSYFIAASGILVAAALLSAPVILLCGLPLALAVEQLRASREPVPETFVLGTLALAWALSIVVEIVYVQDAFDDRMNTLFKFYFQAWTLYAIAAAIAVSLLWTMSRRQLCPRAAIALATGVALLAGLAYPVVASYQWTSQFSGWSGLDGLAFGNAQNAGDVAAIRWLADHGAPGDVILEAAGCSYSPSGLLPFDRISAFTGIPTVIGWDNHERQWRAGQPANLSDITARQEDVLAMYGDPQSALFEKYNVRWMVVGPYEVGNWSSDCLTAGPYSAATKPGFPGPGWTEVFQAEGTRIFERNASQPG